MAYQAKQSQVLSRQLEAQELHVTCDLTTALSDAPAFVTIDNSTLTATVITLDIGEAIEKCFLAEVRNCATGAIVAIAAAPSLAVANKISVTCNGTGITSADIHVVYKVAE